MKGWSMCAEGGSGEEATARTSAAEHMLLAALVELYRDAVENDVRLGLLRILLQALQRHGNIHTMSPDQQD